MELGNVPVYMEIGVVLDSNVLGSVAIWLLFVKDFITEVIDVVRGVMFVVVNDMV